MTGTAGTRISPQLIFGDDSLKIIDFSAIFANPEWLGTIILYFMIVSGIWLVGRMGYVMVKDRRFDDRMVSGFAALTVAILLIAPLLQVRWALDLPQRIGVTPVGTTSSTGNSTSIQQPSNQPIGLAQWTMVMGYALSDLFADHAALKLVSLNPLTAPQMPLLKRQAEQYFENSDEINKVAQENIKITGGAFGSRDFNKHVIDGAGVAYASAGLNQANYTRQNLPSMVDGELMAALGGDKQRIKRLVWLWNKNEAAAMAECAGNTMLSDYAFALSLAKSSTDEKPFAGYQSLPSDSLPAWNDYFSKANAYLYAGGGNTGSAPIFGSKWAPAGGGQNDAGADISLPAVTDILKGQSTRKLILDAESFRGAWSPGTDESELHLNSASVRARLNNEPDAQAQANDTRLLAAVKAREVAELASSTIVDNVTTAFEKIASAHSMANLANQQVGGFMSILSDGIEVPGGQDVVSLVNNDHAMDKCRAFGNRVKALNVGLSLSDVGATGLKEKFSELVSNLPDKGISAARQVASNGWMMLGVYYISTADTYQNFFEGQNEINESAQASSINYMAGDPVSRQAENLNSLGETAVAASGGAMAMRYGNDLKGATKFMGTTGGKLVGSVARKGVILGLLGVWKDFAPYVVFVFVVLWWLLKLVAIFTAMPYIVLFAAGGHIFSERGQWQWMTDLFKRMTVLVFMPVVFVMGWGVIFFGISILDVLVTSTSGKASVGGAATSLLSGNFGQAAFLDSGLVPIILKFVLGLAISTVLLKIEGWIVQYISFGDKSEANMDTGPKPNQVAPV